MSRIALIALAGMFAWLPPQAARSDDKSATKAAKDKAAPAADEKVIQEKARAFLEAFNRGDAAAVARHYAEDGEVIHQDGRVTRGRDAIRKDLEAFFAKNKGARLELNCEAVRSITPDVIIERGCSTLTLPPAPAARSRYTAVLAKRGGEWVIENLRHTADTATAAEAGPLEAMDWMIGEWVEASGDAVVHSVAEWAPGKKFIFRMFTAYQKDRIDLQGTEIIGWDPVGKTIRSWVFESNGGFGERIWSKKDDRWTARCTGTMADGRKLAAVNTYRTIDANRMAWQATARDVGGQIQPDTGEIIVVRKQPKP
jgi:uncharacterized protein (TIGR02246 family)